jgi:hypothetical protein
MQQGEDEQQEQLTFPDFVMIFPSAVRLIVGIL